MQLSNWHLKSLPAPLMSLLPKADFFCLDWHCAIMCSNDGAYTQIVLHLTGKRNDSSLFCQVTPIRSCYLSPVTSHRGQLAGRVLWKRWVALVVDERHDNLNELTSSSLLNVTFHNGKRHIGCCYVIGVKRKLLTRFPEPRLTWALLRAVSCLSFMST